MNVMCVEGICRRNRKIIRQRTEDHAWSTEKGDPKSALCHHQETTGYLVAKKTVIEKTKVLERKARKSYRKVKESIRIKLRGASLNRTDGHDLPLPALVVEGGPVGLMRLTNTPPGHWSSQRSRPPP